MNDKPELTFLETAPFDMWRFQSKSHAQFDAFFEHLASDRQQYKVRKIRFTPGSGNVHIGEAWEVDEKMLWVISHFFSNWDEMYEQATRGSSWAKNWQKKTEQGAPEHVNCRTSYEPEQKEQQKCSICGRYATHASIVHCSDCHLAICRSCLYAHRKTHEAEKAKANWRYCVQCGLSKIVSSLDVCSICHGYVCNTCKEAHQFAHTKSYARCCGCGERTTTECDECKKPYCFPCFARHRAVHEQQVGHKTYRCSGCNRLKTCSIAERAPFWECPTCHEYYCEACTMRHTHVYARANFAGRFNVDDFAVHGVHFGIDPETIKQAKETAERIRQEAETEAKRKQEEARRAREQKEQKARNEEFERERARMNEAFFKNFFTGGSWSYTFDESEETDAYKAHYTGQQQSGHSQYSRQQQTASAPSQELEKAFKLLNLNQRATVQEVRRAFKREAKKAHPDVGGTKEKFVKLNNAYELALQHAERNER